LKKNSIVTQSSHNRHTIVTQSSHNRHKYFKELGLCDEIKRNGRGQKTGMKVFEILFENDNKRMDNIIAAAQSSLNRIGTELDKFSEEKQHSMANMALKTIESSLSVVADRASKSHHELKDAINDVNYEISKLRWDSARKKPIDYIMTKAKELANIMGNVLDFNKKKMPNQI